MNLDKFIKIIMIQLSTKYDVSLVEISKVKDGVVKKTLNFNYKPLNAPPTENVCQRFYNKRQLVSWLSCLE